MANDASQGKGLEGDTSLIAQIVEKMMKYDAAARALGIVFISADEQHAVLQLTIGAQHLNGHGSCHGGVIFTLADTAFAIACNAANHVAVASSAAIEFLSPGKAGETLIASAVQRSQGKRQGIYDIDVRGADDRLVALFRGQATRLKQLVIE
jgi:acyl-CoA thioesterase